MQRSALVVMPPLIADLGDQVTYPNVLRRWLGTVLDGAVIVAMLIAIAKSGVAPDSEGWSIAIVAALVLVYEPLFTVYACTLGQALMRMRVRDEASFGRISLGQAYFRIFLKYFLGSISMLTMPFQKRRQAMHDLAAATLVIEARDAVLHRPTAPGAQGTTAT